MKGLGHFPHLYQRVLLTVSEPWFSQLEGSTKSPVRATELPLLGHARERDGPTHSASEAAEPLSVAAEGWAFPDMRTASPCAGQATGKLTPASSPSAPRIH